MCAVSLSVFLLREILKVTSCNCPDITVTVLWLVVCVHVYVCVCVSAPTGHAQVHISARNSNSVGARAATDRNISEFVATYQRMRFVQLVFIFDGVSAAYTELSLSSRHP